MRYNNIDPVLTKMYFTMFRLTKKAEAMANRTGEVADIERQEAIAQLEIAREMLDDYMGTRYEAR